MIPTGSFMKDPKFCFTQDPKLSSIMNSFCFVQNTRPCAPGRIPFFALYRNMIPCRILLKPCTPGRIPLFAPQMIGAPGRIPFFAPHMIPNMDSTHDETNENIPSRTS